ncbi:MAG: hypothetical protein KGM43_00235, partial [Planctomycetota bacterium]|nr:hypothetical protein [Planctomycetota bacterium]
MEVHAIMYRRSIGTSLVTVAFLAWSGLSLGQETQNDPKIQTGELLKKRENPREALDALQRSHAKDESTFVVESELDGLIPPDGGGACASAACVDSMQVLR